MHLRLLCFITSPYFGPFNNNDVCFFRSYDFVLVTFVECDRILFCYGTECAAGGFPFRHAELGNLRTQHSQHPQRAQAPSCQARR